MRMHVVAVVLVASGAIASASACGESLPASDDVADGSVADTDAATDGANGLDLDAGDSAADVVEISLCDATPCGASVVAQVRPRAIVASTPAVAWLVGSTVFTPNADGGGAIALMTTSAASTGFMAMEETLVMVTQPSGPRGCDVATPCPGTTGPSAPIVSLGDTGPIALRGGDLFVAERAPPRRLVTCAALGNCGDAPGTVAYLPTRATRATATLSHVILGFDDKSVRAYARSTRDTTDGGDAAAPAPPPLVHVDDLTGLVADGPDLYWSDGNAGTLSRCAVATCAASVTTLLSGRTSLRALSVAGGKLYWVEPNADKVLRCTPPACTDPTVIARVRRPIDVAAGGRVYVVSESDDTIYAADR